MAVRVKGNRVEMSCRWQYTDSMSKKPTEADRQYDKPLQVRVTADQLELFRQAAERDGRSLSNWARDRLEKAAKKDLGR